MAKLFVCGDIVNLCSDDVFVGDKLAEIIRDADYSICNFEGPELKPGQSAGCPHQKTGTAHLLNNVGFDLCLLANNHITELGAEGVEYSIAAIKEVGMDYLGAGTTWQNTYRPLICNIGGFKIGIINICEAQVGQFVSPNQTFGYAWMGYDGLYEDVAKLSTTTDYVVVFVHAGLEHYDIPLPEIRALYRRLCASGASAVIGGHPHCAQGWERYNNSVIIYSLGNFFFPLRERWPNESHSYSVVLVFSKDKPISVQEVFHHNDGEKVELECDGINLKNLCSKLDEGYEESVKDVLNQAYSNLCKNLLMEATCGQDERDSKKTIIRKILNYTLFRSRTVYSTKRRRENLLLRLFENETYRWVITGHLKNNR